MGREEERRAPVGGQPAALGQGHWHTRVRAQAAQGHGRDAEVELERLPGDGGSGACVRAGLCRTRGVDMKNAGVFSESDSRESVKESTV